eukprot:9172257-Alexandrium_andersonii.AAC.1
MSSARVDVVSDSGGDAELLQLVGAGSSDDDGAPAARSTRADVSGVVIKFLGAKCSCEKQRAARASRKGQGSCFE